MPRSVSRSGEIAYLVMLVAGFLQYPADLMVCPPVLFIRNLGKLSCLRHVAERRPLLYLQAVAGYMLRPEFEYLSQIAEGILRSLSRYRKHEVEIDIVEAFAPYEFHVSGNVLGSMYAAHVVQPVVIHRLHAHRQPVEAHEPVRLQFGKSDTVLASQGRRICLDGDLSAFLYPERLAYRMHYVAHLRNVEHRRCAPSDVYCVDLRVAEFVSPVSDLVHKSVGIFLPRRSLRVERQESAVIALPDAERYVYIKSCFFSHYQYICKEFFTSFDCWYVKRSLHSCDLICKVLFT